MYVRYDYPQTECTTLESSSKLCSLTSGRLVAATWWMFGFIMIATYTANLAAFLTVSRLDQPIESLDDLAEQFKTKYAPQQSTSTETYFRRMKDIEEKFYTYDCFHMKSFLLDSIQKCRVLSDYCVLLTGFGKP